MDKWLNKFTYKTNIHWWFFAVIGLCVGLVALLTVSSQAIRAALINPTKRLREE